MIDLSHVGKKMSSSPAVAPSHTESSTADPMPKEPGEFPGLLPLIPFGLTAIPQTTEHHRDDLVRAKDPYPARDGPVGCHESVADATAP